MRADVAGSAVGILDLGSVVGYLRQLRLDGAESARPGARSLALGAVAAEREIELDDRSVVVGTPVHVGHNDIDFKDAIYPPGADHDSYRPSNKLVGVRFHVPAFDESRRDFFP